VILPVASRRDDGDDVGRLVAVGAGAAAIAAVALTAAAPKLITMLFGAAFADAIAAVPPLAAGAVAIGAWKMMAAHAVAAGRGAIRARSSITGLVVMVAADLVLVPTLGIGGAGVGAALAYGASAAHIGAWWRNR
jgi:O-antigen/teichoic acid export membrane protein